MHHQASSQNKALIIMYYCSRIMSIHYKTSLRSAHHLVEVDCVGLLSIQKILIKFHSVVHVMSSICPQSDLSFAQQLITGVLQSTIQFVISAHNIRQITFKKDLSAIISINFCLSSCHSPVMFNCSHQLVSIKSSSHLSCRQRLYLFSFWFSFIDHCRVLDQCTCTKHYKDFSLST